MSARAQTVYGGSLPPEWEGSTKGELRVRVDKLLLNDDAINRNPQVKLFKDDLGIAGAPTADAPSQTGPRLGGHRTGAGSSSGHSNRVSPNRFVVPIDYCEVSPLFWGEVQPSCHCQPATPGKSTRGAISLVYPIKCSEEEFVSYLANMTASPHHGMQLEVFVPSSYSGRPAVHVGKSVVCLDTVRPNAPISGWFTVAHYQRAPAGRADPKAPLFVPVGKVKLHIQAIFFSEVRGATTIAPTANTTAISQSANTSDVLSRNSRAASRDGDAKPDHGPHRPTPEQQRVVEQQGEGSTHTEKPVPSAEATQIPAAAPEPALTVTSLSTLPSQSTIAHASAGETLPESTSFAQGGSKSIQLQEVLRQGMELQAKMTQAVRAHLSEDGSGAGAWGSAIKPAEPAAEIRPGNTRQPSNGDADPQPSTMQVDDAEGTNESGVALTPPPALAPLSDRRNDGENGATPPAARSRRDSRLTPPAATAGSRRTSHQHRHHHPSYDDIASVEDEAESLFTSEASEEERALLTGATHAANSGKVYATTPTTAPVPSEPLPHAVGPATTAAAGVRAMPSPHTAVDLVFSDISFASTATTADLSEIRLQVRLSSDITTQTPGSGPFSSYIHQLPFAQPAICLSFNVCSYSEESSRLVVEMFKVVSRPRIVPGSTLLPSPPNAVREVVGEELLGLAIVGLYRQSREVVLRDPVLDASHVYTHLQVYLNGCGEDSHSVPPRPPTNTQDAESGAGVASAHKRPRHPLNSQEPELDDNEQHQQREEGHGEESGDDVQAPDTVSRSQHARSSAAAAEPVVQAWPRDAASVPVSQSQSTSFSAMPRRSSVADSPAQSGVARSRRSSMKSNNVLTRAADDADDWVDAGAAAQSSSHASKRPSVMYVAADGAQAAASGVPLITATHRGRCRLHLAIHGAKHIPHVKIVRAQGSAAKAGVAHARLEGSSLSEDELGRNGFDLPNTFFVVEDVLSGIDHGQPRTAPVAEWFVEEAVKGHYDRTAVAFQNCNPTFDYESVLSLPTEGVFLKQDMNSADMGDANVSAGSSANGGRSRPCLRELVLTVWHYTGTSAAEVPRGNSVEKEQQFWSKVAYVGECRVDLRSLRHIDKLNGYYRVHFTPAPPTDARGDTTSSAKLDYTDADKTIGYAHISVSLLA